MSNKTVQESTNLEEKRIASLKELEKDALRSLENHERTGLHLTGEEVCAWLDTWGTDEETEAPMCHK